MGEKEKRVSCLQGRGDRDSNADPEGKQEVSDGELSRQWRHAWTRRSDQAVSADGRGTQLPKVLHALVQPLHPPARALTRARNLPATSPVSGSLIKLTDAGPSGQAETSGPSRSCHDMMDLSGACCQAATQVHCPVGVHQKTLGKHPADLICI